MAWRTAVPWSAPEGCINVHITHSGQRKRNGKLYFSLQCYSDKLTFLHVAPNFPTMCSSMFLMRCIGSAGVLKQS